MSKNRQAIDFLGTRSEKYWLPFGTRVLQGMVRDTS